MKTALRSKKETSTNSGRCWNQECWNKKKELKKILSKWENNLCHKENFEYNDNSEENKLDKVKKNIVIVLKVLKTPK